MPTLQWVGKDKVKHHHRDVPYRVLRDDYRYQAPEGTPGNSSDNRIIRGDNLEALKSLLPEFEGKVKCIYIDPPYNTGNESWVYNDNVNDPRIRKWLGQVVGKEGEDLSRHDKWLCMMYPRLKLLHRLLADDGVFLVSIDENEHRHLELLLDELFGASNRLETIVWKKSYGGGSKSKHFVNLHEYIVCFAKNISNIEAIELPPDEKTLRYYKHHDEKLQLRGPFRLQPLATNSMDERPNLRYPLIYEGQEVWPEKQWQWSRERAEAAQANNELEFKKRGNSWTVSYKQYLISEEGELRGAKPYSITEGIYTQQGTNEIKAMFGDGKTFSFPKPSSLVTYLLSLFTSEGSLVLDSFGGSGTTAHAVLKLNAQDGGNRRFILIEMMNYAESLTAERVRRVMAGYGEGSKAVAGLGGGFSFQSLGEPLFDELGHLNPAVGLAAIRDYVAYLECISADARAALGNPRHPYWLGEANGQRVFFCYEPERITTLDLDLLAELVQSPGPTLIYADQLALGEDFMRRHGIRFKKIPRDITRL